MKPYQPPPDRPSIYPQKRTELPENIVPWENQKGGKFSHEFEDWQFDWLLEQSGGKLFVHKNGPATVHAQVYAPFSADSNPVIVRLKPFGGPQNSL